MYFVFSLSMFQMFGKLSICHCNQIEKIQNKVLLFIRFKCNLNTSPHSGYEDVLNMLNLNT